MPMLKWAGKEKVVNHHNDAPFSGLGTGVKRALEKQPNIEFYNDFDGDQFKVVIPRLTSKE